MEVTSGNPVLYDAISETDLVVQVVLRDAIGIPIPQNQKIKSGIVKRYVNVGLFDSSAEQLKYSLVAVQAEWDKDTEDIWSFSKFNKNLFVKIGKF